MSLVISFCWRGWSSSDDAFSAFDYSFYVFVVEYEGVHASVDVVVADSCEVGLYGGDRHCGRLEEMT